MIRYKEIYENLTSIAKKLYNQIKGSRPFGENGYSSDLLALKAVYNMRKNFESPAVTIALAVLLHPTHQVYVFNARERYRFEDIVPDTFEQKGDWIDIDGGYVGLRSEHAHLLSIRELKAITGEG